MARAMPTLIAPNLNLLMRPEKTEKVLKQENPGKFDEVSKDETDYKHELDKY